MMDTKIIKKLLLILVLGTLLLSTAGCGLIPGAATETKQETVVPVVEESNVKAEGTVLPKDYKNVWFTANGKVTEILVEEGDEVAAGEVLARLDDTEQMDAAVSSANLELQAAQKDLKDLQDQTDLIASQTAQELIQAEAALIAAEERLENLDTEEYDDKLEEARTKLADAKDEMDTAQEDYDKYADLEEDNANRKNAKTTLDDKTEAYNTARHELDRLENDLAQVKADKQLAEDNLADVQRRNSYNGPNPDAVALAEARVKNAEAQVAAAEAAKNNLEMKSPIDGTVVKIDFVLNEEVAAYTPVLLVADFSQWYVETNDLTEIEVVDITSGMDTKIVPDALPDLTLNGMVEKIEDVYAEKHGDITYTARIRLDDTDSRLRWGMTVSVTFIP